MNPTPLRAVVVLSAGVSDPSSARLLADRIAQKSLDALRAAGLSADVTVVDLGPLAVDIARSLVAGYPSAPVQEVIERLADDVDFDTELMRLAAAGSMRNHR